MGIGVIGSRQRRRAGVRGKGWRKAVIAALGTIALLAAIGVGALYYIGYFSDRVYVDLPAAPGKFSHSHLGAVMFSGDLGFSVGMGPKIGHRLADSGIPVRAVNSLAYFRHERSPAETEALLHDTMQQMLAEPGIDRLVLVGQSFGADMMQEAVAHMSASDRAHVVMLALIVPTRDVYHQAMPSGAYRLSRPDALAITTAGTIDWLPVMCVYGTLEPDSLCPQLTAPNVTKLGIHAGHYLQSYADEVSARIEKALAVAIGHEATGGTKAQ